MIPNVYNTTIRINVALLKPHHIPIIDGIVAGVGVTVHPVDEALWISGDESTCFWVVVAAFVVVEFGLRIVALAGESVVRKLSLEMNGRELEIQSEAKPSILVSL